MDRRPGALTLSEDDRRTLAVTLDTYSHVTPEMDREAANRVAAAIFGAAAEPSFEADVWKPFANGPERATKAPDPGADGDAADPA
jgi:hypothetical protein